MAASVAICRVWQEKFPQLKPEVMAGHSLGEYSALVCAGVLDFQDAIKLVDLRGKLMQQAVPEGTGALYAVVIAGARAAVERAAVLCKEAGAKRALPLAVSVPSHCALMKPAAEQLAVTLENIQINTPTTSVLNNVDVKAETEGAEIRTALVRQLYSPVRWTETVEKMAQDGVLALVEVGPGKVLNGLTKRIVGDLQAISVNDVASFNAVEEFLA